VNSTRHYRAYNGVLPERGTEGAEADQCGDRATVAEGQTGRAAGAQAPALR
jgi:hypothetical protein